MMPLLLSLALLAADPPPNAGPIRLPAVTVTADPKPTPGPDAVTRLTADRLYVLDSDVPVVVLSSPPGLVTLTEDAGPVKVRGQFADGTGKYETRTFTGKYVYTVEASKTGRVELIVVPVGAKTPAEVIRRAIDVVAGDSPQPPQPGPGPAPQPTPGIAPIAGDGFKVLIVYEAMTEQTLPPAQQAAIFGKKTRDYLNAKCAPGPDGKPKEWRIFDQNTPTDGDTQVWRDAMKRPRASVPWLVVSDGKTGFEGPLPATDAEITAILTQFGGK